MPIDDLLGADANQEAVTCKALDVFGARTTAVHDMSTPVVRFIVCSHVNKTSSYSAKYIRKGRSIDGDISF